MLHLYWRFSRGATLGVRALVRDAEGRIFLVKHSYVSGWHLPGGGVEVGETMLAALTRELREEGNIQLSGATRLFAVYFNARISRRDHVALFVVEDFIQPSPPRRNAEITDHGFLRAGCLARGNDTLDPRPHRRGAAGKSRGGTLVALSQGAPGRAAHRNPARARSGNGRRIDLRLTPVIVAFDVIEIDRLLHARRRKDGRFAARMLLRLSHD